LLKYIEGTWLLQELLASTVLETVRMQELQ